MCSKPRPGIDDTGSKIKLMLPQLHLRVHAGEYQMAPVKLTGTNRVESVIVDSQKRIPALRFFPNPGCKRLLNLLLFGTGNHGFLCVDYIFNRLVALFIDVFLPVTDSRGLHIKAILKNLISIFPLGSKSLVDHYGIRFCAFIGDTPGRGIGEILNVNAVPVVAALDDLFISAGLEGFIHELAIILNGNPDGAHIHFDVGRSQRLRLYFFQGLYIPGKEFRFFRCLLTCVKQLIPHMTTEIFFCEFPSLQRVAVVFLGIEIDASIQFTHQFFRFFSRQEGHIGQIHPQLVIQADLKGVLGGVCMIDLTEGADGGFGEDR